MLGSVLLPIRIRSEMNLREHWRTRDRRRKEQQAITLSLLRLTLGAHIWFDGNLTIKLTRLGPRKMDSDNNCIAHKHVRDAIAKWLTIDDGDARLEWVYSQEHSKQYAVRVELEESE